MPFTVLSPRPGETVQLLRPEHLAFLDDPGVLSDERADLIFPRIKKFDLSTPIPTVVSYLPAEDADVWLSRNKDMSGAVLLKGTAGRAYAEGLFIGQRYYLRVGSGEEASAVVGFVTPDRPPRLLSVDGICNVRDVGGWKTETGRRVKQGMICRTSELDVHTAITEEGKRQLVRLGFRTELDIRAAAEGNGAVMDAYGIRYVNIPLKPYAEAFDEPNTANYRDSYRLLLEDVFPLYVHCWGGIDRTGTWIFLLGGMLGVSEEDLLADYEFSGFTVWGRRIRTSDNVRAFLDRLRTFGEDTRTACRAYMLRCGLTPDEIDAIRERLTE